MKKGLLLVVFLLACAGVETRDHRHGNTPPPGPPPPTEPPPAEQKLADGAACDAADQCASGICEGEGCGPGQGVCAARDRACTRDLVAYCSCEGETFRTSGSCPGRRFAHRGECP
jgi:hypothetical protein